ncbi:unnamed protein product [Mytilus coruscus]|uniref:Uncharacterized protein n=1 Tax=Mytilus coruscus TaxID=42192 RepID=A0A6J8BXH2_MYTCO|nr:unnamed protein product [Mytilus coruscus]
MSIQKGDTERRKHHCLGRNINGTLTTNDCRSQKMNYCVDGANGYERWSTAINICLFKNESLSNDRSDYQDNWLGYFMYEERVMFMLFSCLDKENEQCVAILRKDISLSLTNQFKPCSEHLSVLCNEEHNSDVLHIEIGSDGRGSGTNKSPTPCQFCGGVHTSTPVFVNYGSQFSKGSTESIFDRSLEPVSTNSSNVQRPGKKNDTFGKMVIVNVVLFGLCVLIVTMIILRKRLTVQVCQRAGQKFRRNTINKKSMVQKDRNSDIDNGNENRAVHDNYNDPWELRHNIVQLGELNQQDIIDIQMEETET